MAGSDIWQKSCVPGLQQPCPPSARVAVHPQWRLPAPAQPRQGVTSVTSGLLTSTTGPRVILQAGDGAGQAQGQLPGVDTSDRVKIVQIVCRYSV